MFPHGTRRFFEVESRSIRRNINVEAFRVSNLTKWLFRRLIDNIYVCHVDEDV